MNVILFVGFVDLNFRFIFGGDGHHFQNQFSMFKHNLYLKCSKVHKENHPKLQMRLNKQHDTYNYRLSTKFNDNNNSSFIVHFSHVLFVIMNSMCKNITFTTFTDLYLNRKDTNLLLFWVNIWRKKLKLHLFKFNIWNSKTVT